MQTIHNWHLERARLCEKQRARDESFTRSQEESAAVAAWCFVVLFAFVAAVGLVSVVAWALGL